MIVYSKRESNYEVGQSKLYEIHTIAYPSSQECLECNRFNYVHGISEWTLHWLKWKLYINAPFLSISTFLEWKPSFAKNELISKVKEKTKEKILIRGFDKKSCISLKTEYEIPLTECYIKISLCFVWNACR
jgi:hypothetical protein